MNIPIKTIGYIGSAILHVAIFAVMLICLVLSLLPFPYMNKRIAVQEL